MANQPSLRASPRQGQRLSLTPGMRASLSMLRMSALALSEELARMAAENPFLVIEDPPPRSGAFPLEAVEAPREDLRASLVRQISLQKLDPATAAAARLLAEELRDDGYLDTPLDILAAEIGVPEEMLAQGLAALQACEPAGVGARSLAECVRLQLEDRGLAPDVASALAQNLEMVAAARWTALARATGVAAETLQAAAEHLRGISPRPVDLTQPVLQPRLPEVEIVRLGSGELTAVPVDSVLPVVSLLRVDKGSLAAEARDHHAEAVACHAAIQARRQTLLAVGKLLADRQAAFFSGAQKAPLPLARAEAAALLNVHPSTLGRAISGKALAFEGKSYPLDLFFPRPAPGDDPALSILEVQRRIRALVAAEDPSAPLADEAIRAHLKGEGVDIARRTVAKYRKCMRIASSFERRRHRGPARAI